MVRLCCALGLAALLVAIVVPVQAAEITGDYLETRTCDIYTGPCFANGQVGLTGQEALLAWKVDRGVHDGVDLSGLKVVVAVRASDTLGYGGGMTIKPDPIKSIIVVDKAANPRQREALIDFARSRAGKVAGEVVRVESAAIEMNVDHVDSIGALKAGDVAEVLTRKVGQGDCICTNEMVFYPPLTEVENSQPAVAVKGEFTGRGLGSNWSTPNARSAFLATFAY